MEGSTMQLARNVSSACSYFTEMAKTLEPSINSEIEILAASIGLVLIVIIIFTFIISYLMKKNINKEEKKLKKKIIEVFTDNSSQNSKKIDAMLTHNKVLRELHAASDKCKDIVQSMKCIELTIYCPHLINTSIASDGVTPFHRVCYRGNKALIEFMLAKGADPWKKTVAGENAVCLTVQYYIHNDIETKDFPCLETLYHAGCYLPYSDEWYQICVHLAIDTCNKSLVHWLISHSSRKQHQEFGLRTASYPDLHQNDLK